MERRAYLEGSNQRCTVKFKGSIPQWPLDTALGVEWDNPERGRNNGEINGVKYFECRIPNAGSFIKESRRSEQPLSFKEAFKSKYIDKYEFKEIELQGNKVIETHDVDLIHEFQSRTENLSTVSVCDCLVSNMNGANEYNFKNVTFLDIGCNLFSDLSSVLQNIDRNFPNLETLVLNGNRISIDCKVQSKVPNVVMANMLLEPSDLLKISSNFPFLQQLSLSNNLLPSVPLIPNLTELDISGNRLTEIPPVSQKLVRLLASDNLITKIKVDDFLPVDCDLSGNPLDWASISVIGFKQVNCLKVWHSDVASQNRLFTIARCPNLISLDGIPISEDERLDAELFTLSSTSRKQHEPLPQWTYDSLVMKYGEPAVLPSRSIRANLVCFYIDESPNLLQIVKHAPIYRLTMMIARCKGVKPFQLRIQNLEDPFSTILQVRDFIEDGARLKTEVVEGLPEDILTVRPNELFRSYHVAQEVDLEDLVISYVTRSNIILMI